MFSEVVLLAGGVGITAVYSHLEHVEALKTPKKILHVHWAVSNSDFFSWFRKELNNMASLAKISINVHINDMSTSLEEKKDTVSGTVSISNISIYNVNFVPDFDSLISDHCTNSRGPIVFFVCGPAPMTDAVRAGVAQNMLELRAVLPRILQHVSDMRVYRVCEILKPNPPVYISMMNAHAINTPRIELYINFST